MPYFAPHSKLKLGTCIEISVRGINLLLTEREDRTGELARGRDSMDRVQGGSYKTTEGQ